MDASALHGNQMRILGGPFNRIQPYSLETASFTVSRVCHHFPDLSQHWECKCIWPPLTFLCGLWESKHILVLVQQELLLIYIEQLLPGFIKHFNIFFMNVVTVH